MADKLLTRRGARNLTSLLDQVAETVQKNAAVLGIDPKIAHDFAYRSDLLSDAIETTASINFPLEKSAEFDAGSIAEEKPGPVESEKDEPYMKTYDQEEKTQVQDAQEIFEKRMARLEKMIAKMAGEDLPDIAKTDDDPKSKDQNKSETKSSDDYAKKVEDSKDGKSGPVGDDYAKDVEDSKKASTGINLFA